MTLISFPLPLWARAKLGDLQHTRKLVAIPPPISLPKGRGSRNVRPFCSGETGFSLIELIVALSITAVIGVLLLGGYAFAGKAWNRTSKASDAAGEIYTAQSVLRRAFAGLSLDSEQAKFTGDAASLNFTTLFALPGDPPRPTKMGLRIAQCTDGPCLMITLSRPEWANRERETPVSAALMQDIEGISVAYRGKGADAPWQSDWRPGKGAPSLVRIDVALAKGARRWPTLYLVPPSET